MIIQPLSSTIMYKTADKGLKTTDAILTIAENIREHIVPYEFYGPTLILYKNYRYPLTDKILELTKKERKVLIPIFAGELNNGETELKLARAIPSGIFSFFGHGHQYIFLDRVAKYTLNSVSKEIEDLKISEKSFYALLTAGLVAYIFNDKNELRIPSALMVKIGMLYTIMLSKTIDRLYSISAYRESYVLLQYFVAVYFFQSLCGYPKREAQSLPFQMRPIGIERNLINTELRINELGDLTDISLLCAELQLRFPYRKGGEIEYRNVSYQYSKMFGKAALFAIEHIGTFVTMVLLSQLRSKFYNDSMVDMLTKKMTNEIGKSLAQIVTKL